MGISSAGRSCRHAGGKLSRVFSDSNLAHRTLSPWLTPSGKDAVSESVTLACRGVSTDQFPQDWN
jgi:hypothetical protein